MAGTEQKPPRGEVDGAGSIFEEGSVVVYPNHGAGCVERIEERTILGEVRRYYVVRIPDGELTLSIPAEGENGLRPCSDEEAVAGALDALGQEASQMPGNWNHRLKHNQERIGTGGILEVAEVVRNLSSYGAKHGLSTGERNMLAKARRILVSEIALARDVSVGEAESLVDGSLRIGAE